MGSAASTDQRDLGDAVRASIGQLTAWMTGGGVILMIDVAHRTGLLTAIAEAPGSSRELAERAGLSERHVRELLNGLTTAGVVRHDPADGRYALPEAWALCLSGDRPTNFAPRTAVLATFARFLPRVVETTVAGGGIPYSEYRPEFTGLMDRLRRGLYDALLVDGYVKAVPGLHERMVAGCRVADLGCGTGHSINLLGRAYPASTFVGYDLAGDALDRGRAEAAEMALDNVRFEELDVAELPSDPPFDVILAFDSIHDQAAPAAVLARAHAALAPDGVFVMIDADLASDVDGNVGNPLAPYWYACSLFHCMQVSLAEGGPGLGLCWGRETATRMLTEAGFTEVELVPTPEGDLINAIFTARPGPHGPPGHT